MKKFIVSVVSILSFATISAQFVETFADGNITSQPLWEGNTSKFIVNSSYQLQLNGLSKKDTAVVYTKSRVVYNAQWKFDVVLNFNPSSSNYTDIYVLSDTTKAPIKGYFIRVGSTLDNVSLYRQTGGTKKLLIAGRVKLLNSSNNKITIKLIRDKQSNWKLYTKKTIDPTFYLEGASLDATHNLSKYFVYAVFYTTSRKKGFILDNIEVTGSIVAPTPLKVIALKAINANQLEFTFNKPISFKLKDTVNISVTPKVRIDSIFYSLPSNDSVVKIRSPESFMLGQLYKIAWKDLVSQGDTFLIKDSIEFYIAPEPKLHQLLFSEIMFDPTPEVALPEVEYIELYNNSNQVINLKGWSLLMNNKKKVLKKHYIPANSYLTLCDVRDTHLLTSYGKVMGIESFPSLLNTGGELKLTNVASFLIDSLQYKPSLHSSKIKSEGGWSLEMINKGATCLGEKNWKSSINPSGGTPGAQNSVLDANYFGNEFLLDSIVSSSSREMRLYFNANLKNLTPNIFITPALVVDNLQVEKNIIIVAFKSKIALGELYKITLKDVKSCTGLELKDNQWDFIIGSTPAKGEILINEILTDAITQGGDFIELYNNSDNYVNLRDLALIRYNENGVQDSIRLIAYAYFLSPKGYVVITADSFALKQDYKLVKNCVMNTKFPNLNQSEQAIRIRHIKSTTVLDAYNYKEEYHHKLLKTTKGVSLERISFQLNNTVDNWHSASSSSGYATPGYENSQFYFPDYQGAFKLSSDIISPDNDGYQDVIAINLSFNKFGYVGNINVFNDKGELVKQVIRNSLFQRNNVSYWFGDNDNGEVLSTGKYIFLVEAFHPEGDIFHKKIVVGLIK